MRELPQTVLDMIQRIQPHCCGTKAAPIHTAEMCLDVIERGIPGKFIECGIASGAEVSVMAACAVLDDRVPRHVYGLDNFAGIPRAGPQDGEDIAPLVGRGDYRESSGISGCPLETVMANLERWGAKRFTLIPGWFDDTLPLLVPHLGGIAVLRLDANLYASTKVCLDHLFPFLSPGAIVIVDDNAFGVWLAMEEKFSELGINPEVFAVPDTSGTVGEIGIQWFRV